MSLTIYLDHNVIVGVAGLPAWTDAESERACIARLRTQGVRFVLSAWHMYELAKSGDVDNVHRCCAFVEELQPIWANNPIAVKRAELLCFLGPSLGSSKIPTVDDMWASYGESGIQSETFSGVVRALQADPGFLREINEAANLTPGAIVTGRRAHQDGRLKQAEPIIDCEYFAGLLTCDPTDPRVNYLLDNIKAVYRSCPAIAVEDVITHVRIKENFTPLPAHASDLQHALIALAYCTAFVTDDKNLLENARVTRNKLDLPTQLTRRASGVSVQLQA
jgi:hypothetical protein